jgi:hypothetical protein
VIILSARLRPDLSRTSTHCISLQPKEELDAPSAGQRAGLSSLRGVLSLPPPFDLEQIIVPKIQYPWLVKPHQTRP